MDSQSNPDSENKNNENNQVTPKPLPDPEPEYAKVPPHELRKFFIATQNVKTLTDEKLTALKQSMKCEILGLSEVCKSGEEKIDQDDFIFYYKGDTEKGTNGVGFIVKKYLNDSIIEFKGISERIAVINIILPKQTEIWSIIQVFGPPEQADEEEKITFFKTLRETINEAHKNIIVMGDFNSEIGLQQNGELSVGRYSMGVRNQNGQMLVDLTQECNLKIMNTFFQKRDNRRWTWKSPDGNTTGEIDFMISNQPDNFDDVGILFQVNIESDHRLLRAKLDLSPDMKAFRKAQRRFEHNVNQVYPNRKIQNIPKKKKGIEFVPGGNNRGHSSNQKAVKKAKKKPSNSSIKSKLYKYLY